MINKSCSEIKISTDFNAHGRSNKIYACEHGEMELFGDWLELHCENCKI